MRLDATSVNNVVEGEVSPDGQHETSISTSVPLVLTTKRSKKRVIPEENITQSHYQRDKRKKRRKCGKCGLYNTGHNAATCEKSKVIVIRRPRGRPKGTGRKKYITESDINEK